MANVTFNYQEKNSCIHDLSIDVKAGQTLALVGPSGGGKSTIARLLTGIYSPNSGDIFIDNRSITSIPLHSLRRGVVVVPQVTALFDDTVTFNLAVGLPSVSVAAQREALDRVGLEAWVAALPSGLNTMVGPRGLKLSAGQRQRLGLARALLREPKVLVLDEVTSSLDIHTEFDILAAISEMFPHSTKVIIAHRLHTVTHADIIAVVRDGRLVQCGTHAQLIEADGMYACMWLQHSRSTSEPIVEELT
jgi:ATP-binding cassette subfamily B protein